MKKLEYLHPFAYPNSRLEISIQKCKLTDTVLLLIIRITITHYKNWLIIVRLTQRDILEAYKYLLYDFAYKK